MSRTWNCMKHNILSIMCLPFHHILYILMQIRLRINKEIWTTVRTDIVIKCVKEQDRMIRI